MSKIRLAVSISSVSGQFKIQDIDRPNDFCEMEPASNIKCDISSGGRIQILNASKGSIITESPFILYRNLYKEDPENEGEYLEFQNVQEVINWFFDYTGKPNAGSVYSGTASETAIDFNPILDFSTNKICNEYDVPDGEDLIIGLASSGNVAGRSITVNIILDGTQRIHVPTGTILHPDNILDSTLDAGTYYFYFLYTGTEIRLSIPTGKPYVPSSVVFRETFYKEPFTNNGPISHINWYANEGPSGTTVAGRLRDYEGRGSITPVNTGYSDENVVGLIYTTASGVSRDRSFIWTDKYPIQRITQELDNVNFWMGHDTVNAQSSFAVRVDGNWYVYDAFQAMTSLLVSGGEFDIDSELYDVDLDMDTNGKWLTLNFVADTTLSLGSAIAGKLPSGTIEAFGIYTANGATDAADFRFDTLEINIK